MSAGQAPIPWLHVARRPGPARRHSCQQCPPVTKASTKASSKASSAVNAVSLIKEESATVSISAHVPRCTRREWTFLWRPRQSGGGGVISLSALNKQTQLLEFIYFYF